MSHDQFNSIHNTLRAAQKDWLANHLGESKCHKIQKEIKML